eukprot:1383042-Amorphochlora_amoeboformis.AAC.1
MNRSGYGRGPENNSILRSTRGAAALMPRTNAKVESLEARISGSLESLNLSGSLRISESPRISRSWKI